MDFGHIHLRMLDLRVVRSKGSGERIINHACNSSRSIKRSTRSRQRPRGAEGCSRCC